MADKKQVTPAWLATLYKHLSGGSLSSPTAEQAKRAKRLEKYLVEIDAKVETRMNIQAGIYYACMHIYQNNLAMKWASHNALQQASALWRFGTREWPDASQFARICPKDPEGTALEGLEATAEPWCRLVRLTALEAQSFKPTDRPLHTDFALSSTEAFLLSLPAEMGKKWLSIWVGMMLDYLERAVRILGYTLPALDEEAASNLH